MSILFCRLFILYSYYVHIIDKLTQIQFFRDYFSLDFSISILYNFLMINKKQFKHFEICVRESKIAQEL